MILGFYARGPVVLPHPPYPKATLRLVERAIAEAWQVIRDTPEGDFDVAKHDEDRITRELRTCLTNRVLDGGIVRGFTSEQFSVSREAKFESFDGSQRDLMPDLHIDVVRDDPSFMGLSSADGLFVECKPVGKTHPAGKTYCDKGLLRFVSGMYAWALPQALMVGYADPRYTVAAKLKGAMEGRTVDLKTTGRVTKCRLRPLGGYAQHVHETVHDRGFIYPLTKSRAPAIVIRHLWLNRN